MLKKVLCLSCSLLLPMVQSKTIYIPEDETAQAGSNEALSKRITELEELILNKNSTLAELVKKISELNSIEREALDALDGVLKEIHDESWGISEVCETQLKNSLAEGKVSLDNAREKIKTQEIELAEVCAALKQAEEWLTSATASVEVLRYLASSRKS